MYRYSVDNAGTYTSEDFVLFRESPFACWMERLSLENPDHGIPPDVGSLPPRDSIERQDDMADTLRTEGKDVRLIDWDADEPERRSSTLEAMRKGVDFIVNGQLALGPLSGAANLLVRTSGYSELGDYLYIPCDTQSRTSLHSEFRLCFLADLLHSLQGQLPPQMLVIRGGDDLVPLETESYIYHYRAVKQRFMETMRGFRKHRMPDPAESAHFGRWSDCAHEVLKQRLLREEQVDQEQVGEEITDEDYAEPMLKAAGAVAGGDATLDLEARRATEAETETETVQQPASPASEASSTETGAGTQNRMESGFTLAEQAHMLAPDTYKPGPGVYRLGRPRATSPSPPQPTVSPRIHEGAGTVALDGNTSITPEGDIATAESAAEANREYNRRASDKALQNLEFIGSGPHVAGMVLDTAPAPETTPVPEPAEDTSISTAPAPSLRDPRSRSAGHELLPPLSTADVALGKDTAWGSPVAEETIPTPDTSVFESTRPQPVAHPTIDMDGPHLASPPPALTTSHTALPDDLEIGEDAVEHGFGQAAGEMRVPEHPAMDTMLKDRAFTEELQLEGSFSDSLITSDDYND